MLDWSPAWFKRNRDRQSDPNLLAYGTEIIGGNPRMNVNKIGNEFVLTVSSVASVHVYRNFNATMRKN